MSTAIEAPLRLGNVLIEKGYLSLEQLDDALANQQTDGQGKLLFMWGEEGSELGQLYYPYDLALDGKGHLYICEYGNHRVQKFTKDGKFISAFGVQGSGDGQFNLPWGIDVDAGDNIYVADASVIPTIPRANTNLPTLVIAERIVECLR